jgi:protein TonB
MIQEVRVPKLLKSDEGFCATNTKTIGSGRVLWFAFLSSILFHGLTLISLRFYDFQFKQKVVSQSPIEISLMEAGTLREILEKREKTLPLAEKQIVETAKTGRDEAPTESRFVGEKDQTVDRQTMAKVVAPFHQGGGDKKVAASKRQGKPAKDLSLSDLSLVQFDAHEELSPSKAQIVAASSFGDGEGVDSSSDFVEDVPLGDTTALNTIEFKYFGFYHRIRQKLEQHWGLSVKETAEKMFRGGRNIASSNNLVTALIVQIDEGGNVIRVKIVGTSGIQELDDAAVNSFNKAGPFPNPPRGMIKNGMATIKWGFVVKS